MKLTRKQKAFANHLLNNPTHSATKAVQATYNPTTYDTARQIASQNLTRPSIQLYLNEHIDKAKNRVVELIDSKKEDIALRSSEAVLNRALGTPTQRIEQHTTGVNISINLTGMDTPD